MSSPAFYLGRKQKIFGPLTLAEVEALRNNGQIEGYSWIWMPGAQEWTALDAAPPAPPANVTASTTVEPLPAVAPTRKAPDVAPPAFQQKELAKEFPKFKDTRIAKARNEAFRAILFDGRNAVTAWVSEASAEGCEIRATEQGPDPFFVQKAGAMIHLHEVATGRTTKIPVSVSDVYRQDHHWVYKVRWTSVPSLFASDKAA